MAVLRRIFSKFGIVGVITRAAGGITHRALYLPASLHRFVLDDEIHVALTSMFAVMLEPVFSSIPTGLTAAPNGLIAR